MHFYWSKLAYPLFEGKAVLMGTIKNLISNTRFWVKVTSKYEIQKHFNVRF